MQQRELGNTGLMFKAIGLGAMPLSISGRPDEAQAFAVIEAFVADGGNFIDTANVYCLDDDDIGHNERLIRQALDRLGASEQIMTATKGGLRRPGGAWVVDGDPDWLRLSCERSLQALQADCIGLYQLHAIDPRVLRLPWELIADEGGHIFTNRISVRRRMSKTIASPQKPMA